MIHQYPPFAGANPKPFTIMMKGYDFNKAFLKPGNLNPYHIFPISSQIIQPSGCPYPQAAVSILGKRKYIVIDQTVSVIRIMDITAYLSRIFDKIQSTTVCAHPYPVRSTG